MKTSDDNISFSKGGVPPTSKEISVLKDDCNKKHIIIVGFGMVGFAFLEKMLVDDTAGEYRLTIIGDEPHLAYNRVGLTEYFEHQDFDKLLLAPHSFYDQKNAGTCEYRVNQKVTKIEKEHKYIETSNAKRYHYDYLVLATGSYAVLPIDLFPRSQSNEFCDLKSCRKLGCFVYRTIDDLNAMISFSETIRSTIKKPVLKRAVIVGGGLLGLEAAKALLDMECYDEVTIVHRSKWLLSQQLDEKGGNLLTERIAEMGVKLRTDTTINKLQYDHCTLSFEVQYNNGDVEVCQLLCYTIGIKPQDILARSSGLKVAKKGGIEVDNFMKTSNRYIYAIGECASWNNQTFGLIAPGVMMADILSFNLIQAKYHSERQFTKPDIGTRLKLMGVNVASFGDYFADKNGPSGLPKGYKIKKVKSLVYDDPIEANYTKLLLTYDGKYLLGGILVGDTTQFTKLASITKSGKPLEKPASTFIIGQSNSESNDVDDLPDDTQVCSCHNVTKGKLIEKIKSGTCNSLGELKSCTKAGTACGGCEPTIKVILDTEMKKMGKNISKALCIHYKESRQDLFSLIMVKRYKSFKEVMSHLGVDPCALGCEICKPTIASILATLFNRHILETNLHGLQDTNDKYLGNIQRNGTYSIVPRMSAGEVTPEKLVAIGEIARKYDLYTKITGAQRVDLFGASKSDLPKIWEELGKYGFESGQAYGKSLRNVKSCVGSTWCRYGIGDSVGLALRLEERYKGIRSPHKMKGGVSGCIRDCAEFHSKDFGLCAVQNGFNLYVGGNGGMKPAHAQLLKADVPPDQVIPLLDRYLMFYFRTADRLQRTARWLENLDGGIEYLREVVVYDKLGIAMELEKQMNQLVSQYFDEWAAAVDSYKYSNIFKQFVNTDKAQETVEIIRDRGQRRPVDWPEYEVTKEVFKDTKWSSLSWVKVCQSNELPDSEAGSSANVLISDTQIAVYRLNGKLFASQNMCGHKRAFVLSQGILSMDGNKNTYISCPLHKKNYIIDKASDKAGSCTNDASQSVALFDVMESNGEVFVKLPPIEELDKVLGTSRWKVRKEESESNGSIATYKNIDEAFNIKVPIRKPIPSVGCSGGPELDW